MRALHRTALPLVSLLAVAAIAAGCGDDDEDSTVTETVSAPATETTVDELRSETTASTAPSTGTQGPDYFQTPSGNIGCSLEPEFVRCDIAKRDWEPPPDPAIAECEEGQGGDYGQGIQLDETHAEFTCSGDTTLGGPDTLGYGETAQRGPFVCDSGEAGLVCSHTGNGHGFELSRQGYRIF